MLKNIFATFVIGLVMISCNQVSQNSSEEIQTRQIAELLSEPLGYEGTEVSFEGTIGHICRHGGDKMRVNQISDQDYSILVMLQDFQSQINQEFEGKQVKVNGILKTEVIEPEENHTHNHDHDHDHADHDHGHANHDHEHANHDHDHASAEVNEDDCESTEQAIKKLEEKGIEPNIFTFVEMTSFKIINNDSDSKEEMAEVN
ncbi:MAG: hypothetical protein ACOCYO_06475 [Bacteroidota bacterium]